MIWAVVGAVVVIGAFVAEGMWERRHKAKTPTRIADCQDGVQVMIVGKVVPINTLTAPATGRDCVAYVIVASAGNRETTHFAATEFCLDDGSGQAIIDANCSGASVRLDLVLQLGRNLRGSRLDRRDVAALARMGVRHAHVLREGALEPGVMVAVFGEVQLLSVAGTSAASGYRDGHVTRVKIGPPRKGVFEITDRSDVVGTPPLA